MLYKKILNLLLILLPLAGYLEWGKNQHGFIFQMEAEVFTKGFRDPSAVMHPFVILPLLGQLLLLYTLFQRNPSRHLSLAGIVSIALLMSLMLFIGLMESNLRITASVLPFFLVMLLAIRAHRP